MTNPAEPADGPLLTTADVAAVLQLHLRTVERYLREGRIPSVRINSRHRRVRPADLAAFIEAQTEATGGAA